MKRFAFWILFLIVGVVPWSMGMVRWVKGPAPEASVPPAPTTEEKTTEVPHVALSLAEGYVTDYLSWEIGPQAAEARTQRLKVYGETDGYGTVQPAKDSQQTVLQARAVGAQWVQEQLAVVTVRALVQVTVAPASQPTQPATKPASPGQPDSRTSYQHLSVTLRTDGARWAVEGYPRPAPDPGLPTLTPGLPPKQVVDSGSQIPTLVSGFIRSYLAGEGLSVYVAPGVEPPTAVSRQEGLQLVDLVTSQFSYPANDSTDLANGTATVTVRDRSGSVYRMTWHLDLQRVGGRWYVKQLL